jgi:predicted dehydrogenase
MLALKPVNLGFVGLGFGAYLLEQLLTHDAVKLFNINAVCDVDLAKAQYFAKRVGAVAHHDLAELLADPRIEAIGLFTGPNGRAALVQQIIRAGKHVLTTKPFDLEPRAALEVLQEAKQLGRVVHLNSPSALPSPDLAHIQHWCNKYPLGRPIAARAEAWHGGALREIADGSWYDNPALCPVAPIFRIGIYSINDLVRLWGEAESVQVMHARLVTQRPTPDTAQLSLLFKNGALATVFASLCIDDTLANEYRLTLNYEHGTIYRNVGASQAARHHSATHHLATHHLATHHLATHHLATHLSLVAKINNVPVVEHADFVTTSGDYQWETFYRAVTGEKLEAELTPEQIVAGLQIIQAMQKAEHTQCLQPVLPVG